MEINTCHWHRLHKIQHFSLEVTGSISANQLNTDEPYCHPSFLCLTCLVGCLVKETALVYSRKEFGTEGQSFWLLVVLPDLFDRSSLLCLANSLKYKIHLGNN